MGRHIQYRLPDGSYVNESSGYRRRRSRHGKSQILRRRFRSFPHSDSDSVRFGDERRLVLLGDPGLHIQRWYTADSGPLALLPASGRFIAVALERAGLDIHYIDHDPLRRGNPLDHVYPELPNDVRMPARIKHYLLVAKPGIVFGNMISAAAGFFLASKGRVDGFALLATLVGVCLVVASGCVFNNCIDRKIDRKMIRTRDRALAKGLISLKIALSYAALLGVAGVATLWAATNLLAVVIVLAGLVIYVGVYSLYMKRNSVYSALIGSLAGATPPLAGYCAGAGCFDMGALILLAIFSLWQMPHCYAIAVYRLEDYTAAAIPVLPVKQGTAVTRKHIVGYILAFMAATLTLTCAGYTGYGALTVATALGVSWLYLAWFGYKASDERLWARKLFIFSIVTIFIVSVMMSIDFTSPVSSALLMSSAP